MKLPKLKDILKKGLKLSLKIDVFGEKKLKKVHPTNVKRTSWEEDILGGNK